MTELSYTHIDSPVGLLLVAGDDDALHYLSFPNSPKAFRPQSNWHRTDAPFLEVKRQLRAQSGDYQPHNHRSFEDCGSGNICDHALLK